MPKPAMKKPAGVAAGIKKPTGAKPAGMAAGITEANLQSKGQGMTLGEKIALARSRSMTADELADELSGEDYKKSPQQHSALLHLP